MKFNLRYLCLSLALIGQSFSLARAGEAVRPANEIPVELSPYEVVANTVEFQHWIKLSSEHFILYTDTREKTATSILRHMEMLRTVEESFFRRSATKSAPTLVVLPTRASDWAKIASKGTVQWKVAVSTIGAHTRKVIVVQYDWEEIGLATFYDALASAISYEMNLNGPLWFRYGVGNFFATAEFDDDSLAIGRATGYVNDLREGRWMNWPDFFEVERNSPEFTQEPYIHRYAAQTAVFTQFMLTNKDPAWLERLLQWCALMDADNPPKEEDFKSIMGHDWKSWQETMDHYLRYGEYEVRTYKLSPAVTRCPIQKHELHTREMRDLFVLVQIGNQDISASNVALNSILTAGLKTTSLREVLYEDCRLRRRPEKALELARQLMAEGSTNPGIWSEAASLLFYKNVPKIILHANLGADSAEIESWCRHALELEPRNAEANRLLAWTLAFAPAFNSTSSKEIKVIYNRIRGEVSTSPIIAAFATSYWRAGKLDAARQYAEMLTKSPLAYKTDRALAADLLSELPAPATPATK